MEMKITLKCKRANKRNISGGGSENLGNSITACLRELRCEGLTTRVEVRRDTVNTGSIQLLAGLNVGVSKLFELSGKLAFFPSRRHPLRFEKLAFRLLELSLADEQ